MWQPVILLVVILCLVERDSGKLGPFAAINPRVIWKIVVLMMSVSALGYIAVRVLGARYGLPLAGLASGFASSAATVAAVGARVKEQPELARAATAGAVLSSIATIVELAVVLQATHRSVLWLIKFPLIASGAAIAAYSAIFTFRTLKRQGAVKAPPGSAFNLRVTLILAATIMAVTLASGAVNAWLGHRGVVVATAIAGFADAHSAAVSAAVLAASGKMAGQDGIIPIFAGLAWKTATKAGLAFTSGGRGFAARVVPGLIVMIAALWVAFWV